MGKLLTAVLGLALLGGGAWYALQRTAAVDATAPGTSAPKRQLDNVRGAASRIESEADARAKELEAKMRTD
ncbi:hypothetical protein ACN28S_48460 [Cystobacter fuscus]